MFKIGDKVVALPSADIAHRYTKTSAGVMEVMHTSPGRMRLKLSDGSQYTADMEHFKLLPVCTTELYKALNGE